MNFRLACAGFAGIALFAIAAPATAAATAPALQLPAPAHATYYKNCTEARAAGVTPLHRGDDGYAEHLDRDGDGIACE